ncbi:hypothetical protein AB0C69_28550 [Actinomadura sp. NPDC048032]|uniref:hypothetical protein n=1 Tax=Actinomadura sp. NPDC048032 TaxID=3155747 RepID=UPI0033DD9DE2
MSQDPPFEGSPEEIKAELSAMFQHWSVIFTRDTRRWWASRTGVVSETLGRDAVDADTPEELRARIVASDQARGMS